MPWYDALSPIMNVANTGGLPSYSAELESNTGFPSLQLQCKAVLRGGSRILKRGVPVCD